MLHSVLKFGDRCTGTRLHPSAYKYAMGGKQLNKLDLNLSVRRFQNNSGKVGAAKTEECTHWWLTVALFQTQCRDLVWHGCSCVLVDALHLLNQMRSAEAPVTCGTKRLWEPTEQPQARTVHSFVIVMLHSLKLTLDGSISQMTMYKQMWTSNVLHKAQMNWKWLLCFAQKVKTTEWPCNEPCWPFTNQLD